MQQKTKQRTVTNQINTIRRAVKTLQLMEKNGLYIDKRQRNAIAAICDIELAPLSI